VLHLQFYELDHMIRTLYGVAPKPMVRTDRTFMCLSAAASGLRPVAPFACDDGLELASLSCDSLERTKYTDRLAALKHGEPRPGSTQEACPALDSSGRALSTGTHGLFSGQTATTTVEQGPRFRTSPRLRRPAWSVIVKPVGGRVVARHHDAGPSGGLPGTDLLDEERSTSALARPRILSSE
jgi:hypothetical protein